MIGAESGFTISVFKQRDYHLCQALSNKKSRRSVSYLTGLLVLDDLFIHLTPPIICTFGQRKGQIMLSPSCLPKPVTIMEIYVKRRLDLATFDGLEVDDHKAIIFCTAFTTSNASQKKQQC